MAEYIDKDKILAHLFSLQHTELDVMKEIAGFPDADVAPVVHGRWIENGSVQICSVCGEEHEWENYRAPYCDTCGAMMDKEE